MPIDAAFSYVRYIGGSLFASVLDSNYILNILVSTNKLESILNYQYLAYFARFKTIKLEEYQLWTACITKPPILRFEPVPVPEPS